MENVLDVQAPGGAAADQGLAGASLKDWVLRLRAENRWCHESPARAQESLMAAPHAAETRGEADVRRRGLALMLLGSGPQDGGGVGDGVGAVDTAEARRCLLLARSGAAAFARRGDHGNPFACIPGREDSAGLRLRDEVAVTSSSMPLRVSDLNARVELLRSRKDVLSREKQAAEERLKKLQDERLKVCAELQRLFREDLDRFQRELRELDNESSELRLASAKQEATASLRRVLRAITPKAILREVLLQWRFTLPPKRRKAKMGGGSSFRFSAGERRVTAAVALTPKGHISELLETTRPKQATERAADDEARVAEARDTSACATAGHGTSLVATTGTSASDAGTAYNA